MGAWHLGLLPISRNPGQSWDRGGGGEAVAGPRDFWDALIDSDVRGTAHPEVWGLSAFSVQSAPGVTVDELARAGGFRNGQLSVVTRERLQRHGFDVVFPTPGKGVYHATIQVPCPLPLDVAALLSDLFTRRRNPFPVV